MPARANALGFTLVELMIAVGIVGVLAVIALPAMGDLVVANRMKTLSLDLYTSLALARSEAIKRNSNNVSMIPTAGAWQNGWTVCVDTNANGVCDAGEVVVTTYDAIDPSLALTGPAGPALITVNRDGRLATASASFRINYTVNNNPVNNNNTPMRCVELSVSGRPKTLVDTNFADNDNLGCT